jgi:hypothetical protein
MNSTYQRYASKNEPKEEVNMKKINVIQELNLKLIATVRFNDLNGKMVVAELRKNKDLWDAVVIDREYYAEPKKDSQSGCDLIKLRDLPDNLWNVDTVFILSSGKDDILLEAVAKGWSADEIEWIKGDRAGTLLGSFPAKQKILKIWWD